jgi:hypothetical protein
MLRNGCNRPVLIEQNRPRARSPLIQRQNVSHACSLPSGNQSITRRWRAARELTEIGESCFGLAYDVAAMESDPIRAEYEAATIKAFVVRGRQERFLHLLANPKRRKKFLDELGHFRWFDPRFATAVPWKVDPTLSLWGRHLQGIANITQSLRSKGARETCWAISQRRGIDGQELELNAAVEAAVGGIGSILCCVPGKLAYFNGEDESLLLSR